jgi:hypothetical protein
MSGTILPWTVECERRAEKVNALLTQAAGLGVLTTRRQARKALSGRGHLLRDLIHAEAERNSAVGR